MRRPISRLNRNCALRLVSITASQYSSGCSAAGLRRMVPALLIRMSMAKGSRESSAASPRTSSRLPKSQANGRNERPSAVTSRSTSLPGVSVRLMPTISAPASARATAIDLPIPRLHPVTTAVCPSSRNRSKITRSPGGLAHQHAKQILRDLAVVVAIDVLVVDPGIAQREYVPSAHVRESHDRRAVIFEQRSHIARDFQRRDLDQVNA